jgi:uncharacterized protein (TIGR02266 family)
MIPSQSLQHRRAKLQWPIQVRTANASMEGVTLTVSSQGLFVACVHPLQIYDVCEIILQVPNVTAPVKAAAQVVWANVHGPDDDASPRGMGVRFTRISGKDREAISRYVLSYFNLKDVKPDNGTIEVSGNGNGGNGRLR